MNEMELIYLPIVIPSFFCCEHQEHETETSDREKLGPEPREKDRFHNDDGEKWWRMVFGEMWWLWDSFDVDSAEMLRKRKRWLEWTWNGRKLWPLRYDIYENRKDWWYECTTKDIYNVIELTEKWSLSSVHCFPLWFLVHAWNECGWETFRITILLKRWNRNE